MSISEIWSLLTPGHLTAWDLYEESVVLGDDQGAVIGYSVTGEETWRVSVPAPVRDVSVGDDGLVGVACGEGEVLCLVSSEVLFRYRPGPSIDYVRLGPHGDYLLALSPEGEGVFLNRFGREMGKITVPGGVLGVTVVRNTGQIVTVSPGGRVRGFASWGKAVWEAESHPTAEAPSVDDGGGLVLVPIMAYGVDAYTAAGEHAGAYDVGEAVKIAACSGDGERLLLATTDERLVLLKKDASVVTSEVFPAPIVGLKLSTDASLALVTTGSGYAHLLALAGEGESRFLEMTSAPAATRRPWILREKVFSPYSLVVRPRIALARDGRYAAVAGDRQRVLVVTDDGDTAAVRRYAGSLLAVRVLADGDVRVFASRSIFRFHPGDDESTPEWVAEGDLAHVAIEPEGSAIGLTEAGEVIALPRERGAAKRLFGLPGPDIAGLAAAGESMAVTRKSGRVEIWSRAGEGLATCGPFPVTPRLLAASEDGYLVGVAKLAILYATDGEEKHRFELPTPVDRAVALPGAYLVVDDSGEAHIGTVTGAFRPVFHAGKGAVVPCPDIGEGPGFVISDGSLIQSVRPDGSPRWRFRAPEEFCCAAASADGRRVAAVAGTELFLFPSGEGAGEVEGGAPSEFLEFADG